MFRSLADNNFLAIFLCQWVAGQIFDLVTSEGASYLVDLIDRVLLIHAEGFNGENHFRILWVGESPNVSESPGCERSLAGLADRVRNRV